MFTIKSPKSGYIIELFAQDGERVKKGTKLLRIDSDVESAHLSRLAATIASFHAIKESLSKEVERTRLDAIDNSYRAYDLDLSASREAYKGVREEAKAGQRTTLDVLNSVLSVHLARITLLKTATKSKHVASEYNHRRRAIEIILNQLEREKGYWENEISSLILSAPSDGRVRLLVDAGSPVKLSGAVGTIEPES